MVTLDSDKAYVIKTVSEHLLMLNKTWNLTVDDSFLKITSNTLRILLVDNNFRNAWRFLGLEKQPQICTLDLREEIKKAGNPRFRVALLGGGVANNEGCVDIAVLFIDASTPLDTSNPEPTKRLMNLNKYCQSSCIIFGEKYKVSRNELIQYVANKLGGAHIDIKRNPKKRQNKNILNWIN